MGLHPTQHRGQAPQTPGRVPERGDGQLDELVEGLGVEAQGLAAAARCAHPLFQLREGDLSVRRLHGPRCVVLHHLGDRVLSDGQQTRVCVEDTLGLAGLVSRQTRELGCDFGGGLHLARALGRAVRALGASDRDLHRGAPAALGAATEAAQDLANGLGDRSRTPLGVVGVEGLPVMGVFDRAGRRHRPEHALHASDHAVLERGEALALQGLGFAEPDLLALEDPGPALGGSDHPELAVAGDAAAKTHCQRQRVAAAVQLQVSSPLSLVQGHLGLAEPALGRHALQLLEARLARDLVAGPDRTIAGQGLCTQKHIAGLVEDELGAAFMGTHGQCEPGALGGQARLNQVPGDGQLAEDQARQVCELVSDLQHRAANEGGHLPPPKRPSFQAPKPAAPVRPTTPRPISQPNPPPPCLGAGSGSWSWVRASGGSLPA